VKTGGFCFFGRLCIDLLFCLILGLGGTAYQGYGLLVVCRCVKPSNRDSRLRR
jgi:hypothetical protein